VLFERVLLKFESVVAFGSEEVEAGLTNRANARLLREFGNLGDSLI
jgi:hypothetical protein